MKIGAKVKELRVQKGLTQEELADRTELSKGFISQLERDLTSPSIATLMDILQALGTDLKDLMKNRKSRSFLKKATTLKSWTKNTATKPNGSFQTPRKTLWSPSA